MVDARWPTALVTGASAGLGTSFARQLVERGTQRVVLVARREERLRELADELEAAGATAEVLPADLTDPGDRERVEDRLARVERPIDLLVNNAGFGEYALLADRDLDDITRELDLDVTALTRLAAVAARTMRARGTGGIVNVGSTAGFVPIPHQAVYSAAKAYVNSFTEALHEELRPHGVRVVLLCPGFTRTEFQETAGIDGERIPGPAWLDADEVVAAALDALASGRARSTPGALYKAGAVAARLSPPVVTRRFIGAATRLL